MTHLLYELACNPKLSLTSRYEFARYLQAQRKKQKKRESNFRYQLKKNEKGGNRMKTSRIEFSRTQDKQKQHTLEDSISDYRKVYPELTDQQVANQYQMRYGIKASRVLHILTTLKQGGGVA